MRIMTYLLGVNKNVEKNFLTSSEKDEETTFETNEGKNNHNFKSIVKNTFIPQLYILSRSVSFTIWRRRK